MLPANTAPIRPGDGTVSALLPAPLDRQEAADAVLQTQQRAREEQQPRDDVVEQLLGRDDEEYRAEQATRGRGERAGNDAMALPREVVALRERPAEVAGAQRHGVGHVGAHRRHAEAEERGERDERAAARDSVDDASTDRRHAREHVIGQAQIHGGSG
jgi:hypothetical protein